MPRKQRTTIGMTNTTNTNEIENITVAVQSHQDQKGGESTSQLSSVQKLMPNSKTSSFYLIF
jgi:hypothetical protein